MRKMIAAALLLATAAGAQAQTYYMREKIAKSPAAAATPAAPTTPSTCTLTSPNMVYSFIGSGRTVGQINRAFAGTSQDVQKIAKDYCDSLAGVSACEGFVSNGKLNVYAYSTTGGANFRQDSTTSGRTYPWAGSCTR